MTTIVYDHKSKQIACDSRATIGDVIAQDDAKKWKIINGCYWFFAGSAGDIDSLVCAIDAGIKCDHAPDVFAFMVDSGQAFVCGVDDESGMPIKHMMECSQALGSGEQFALTALDLGCSARQAVEQAKKRDVFSGGKVRVFDVVKMKFIK